MRFDPFAQWHKQHPEASRRMAWNAALKFAIDELCMNCRSGQTQINGIHSAPQSDRGVRCKADALHAARELSRA